MEVDQQENRKKTNEVRNNNLRIFLYLIQISEYLLNNEITYILYKLLKT